MRKTLLLVIPLFLMCACSSDKNAKVPGIDLGDLDTSVSPKDNFYAYANGGWIQKNPLKLVICNIENALKKIVNTWNNLLAFTFWKSLFHKLFYGTRSQTPPCFRSLFA